MVSPTQPIPVAGPSSGIVTGGGPSQSRHPKLDGVLYHFYSKTSAVITTCRLTHFDPTLETAMTGSSSNSLRQQQQSLQSQARRMSSESQSSASIQTTPGKVGSGRRASKWFALEIDDHDVFREEVRLWRNVSLAIPDAILNHQTQSTTSPVASTSYVPPMILDVILDTSSLTSKHVLMVEEAEEDGKTRRRVRADGQDTDPLSRRSSASRVAKEQQQPYPEEEPRDAQRQSIVLESWRLEFAAYSPLDPPDLPTLYKHATAHFRNVYATVLNLPAYQLHRRLKLLCQQSGETQKLRRETLECVPDEVDDSIDSANLLKVGVRLAIESSHEQTDGIISLRDPVGSMRHATDGVANVTSSHVFPSILSPIGSLQFSVEYRRNVDFYVEDWHVIKSLQEIALDEDYFKPTIAKHLERRAVSQQGSLSPSPKTQPVGLPEKPRSLLSVTSTQQHYGQSTVSAQNAAGSSIAPVESSASRAAIPPATPSSASTFTSTTGTPSGRPVAGLASLRANPSIAGYSASPSTAGVSNSGTSSPALTAALATDAAFLTHTRRSSSSMSERRLRTLSTLNSSNNDKEASPSPTLPSGQPAGRPILTRAAASAIPRSGSYSPSSPSPLAQQLYAQQNIALAGLHSQSGRLSSSPSFRGGFASSISPSLRSVFQTYTPSQSQTSVSSLSRTPPRSLLEPQVHAQSLLGLRDAENPSGNQENYSILGSSSSSSVRQPTVGPQMIKRYSSTFGYRQGRQTSSIGSEGGSNLGMMGAAEGSPRGVYSKSWQSRTEQRQMYAGRSLGREEGTHFPTSSPAAVRYPSFSGSTGHEEELDEFMRMLESKPSLDKDAVDAFGTTPGTDGVADQGGSLQLSRPSKAEVGRSSPDNLDDVHYARSSLHTHSSQPSAAQAQADRNHISSALDFPRTTGLNRTQVDEMLNKMQSTMREFSTSIGTSRSSPASGGAATSSSGGGQSQPEHSPSSFVSGRSPAVIRSPLSRGTYTAPSTRSEVAMESIMSDEGIRQQGGDHSLTSVRKEHLPTGMSQPPALNSSVARARLDNNEDDEYGEGINDARDNREESRLSRSHPGRTTSRGSLELYGGTAHSYDPLEDEAAGRLELASEELPGPSGGEGAGVGSVSGVGMSLQSRGHGIRSTSAGPVAPVDEEIQRQRQADYELARNFTQNVSIRGGAGNGRTPVSRVSMSPWRLRGYHHPTGQNGATAAAAASSSSTANGNLYSENLIHAHHHIHRGRHTPHGHTSHGTRSGHASVGPASRATSPKMDDDEI